MVLPGDAIVFDKRFKVLSVVGRGRETVVYHAAVGDTDEHVALKVLAGRKHRDIILSRLRHEANILLISEHQHIIKLHGLHAMGDHIYLALEYAPHGDLYRYSQRRYNGPLQPAQAKLFFMQCLQALIHLEEIGVVHRDIKPDNILVMADDSCRLADFGVAAYSKLATDSKELQLAVGTINYLSPQLLEGGICNHHSDLYALGLTFYHLVSGNNPFDDIPLIEQLELRRSLKIPHLRDVAPRLDQTMTDVIMRMLAYDPKDRYASAHEVYSVLSGKKQSSVAMKQEMQIPETEQTVNLAALEETTVLPRGARHIPSYLEKPSTPVGTSIVKRDKIDSMANSMKKRDKSQKEGTEGIPSEVLSRFRMVGADGKSSKGVDDTASAQPFSVPGTKPPKSGGKPFRSLFKKLLIALLLAALVAVGVVVVYGGEQYPKILKELSFGILDVGQPNAQQPAANTEPDGGTNAADSDSFTDGFGSSSFGGDSDDASAEPEGTMNAGEQAADYPEDTLDGGSFGGSMTDTDTGTASFGEEDDQDFGEPAAINSNNMPGTTDSGSVDGAFPMQRGFHVGSINGLFPQGTTHISMVVLPDNKGAIVLVGIEGWTPQRIPSVSRSGQVVRVASNGVVLQMTFNPTENGAGGTVEDMSSGRQGSWEVKRNLSQ